nr:hypothetical protein [Tanacetum cinerariifolium]
MMHSTRSNEDLVTGIAKSVFVTNFLEYFVPRNLWKICESYGKVVDVFIPNRKSKEGKHFAFVRFIRVANLERLIGNLKTIWVGRLYLRVNAVRYERPSKPQVSVRNSVPTSTFKPNLHVNAVKKVNDSQSTPIHTTQSFSNPALVIDYSCLIERDLKCHAMGKVKDVNSIPNLPTILAKEGFEEVNLSYLGGLWVMLELHTEEIKDKIIRHMGVNSWFNVLQPAIHDFISEERIVWVDIEGIPMHAWSRNTFLKIGTRWGEALDIEESYDTTFARKRLCIKTNLSYNILECFKAISRGKAYMVRAKELFTWTPQFRVFKGTDYMSDDEPQNVVNKHNDSLLSDEDGAEVNDDAGGTGIAVEENTPSPTDNAPNVGSKADEQQSDDPFGVYDLLKRTSKGPSVEEEVSLPYPPGFTPGVMNFSHISDINESSCGASTPDFKEKMVNGGSMLDILDYMIRVGQSMGYDMEGCSKDIERIIGPGFQTILRSSLWRYMLHSVRHNMVRELITNGVISMDFVRSQYNLADHLTKGLARDLVHKSAIRMGLKSI